MTRQHVTLTLGKMRYKLRIVGPSFLEVIVLLRVLV